MRILLQRFLRQQKLSSKCTRPSARPRLSKWSRCSPDRAFSIRVHQEVAQRPNGLEPFSPSGASPGCSVDDGGGAATLSRSCKHSFSIAVQSRIHERDSQVRQLLLDSANWPTAHVQVLAKLLRDQIAGRFGIRRRPCGVVRESAQFLGESRGTSRLAIQIQGLIQYSAGDSKRQVPQHLSCHAAARIGSVCREPKFLAQVGFVTGIRAFKKGGRSHASVGLQSFREVRRCLVHRVVPASPRIDVANPAVSQPSGNAGDKMGKHVLSLRPRNDMATAW